MSLENKNKEYWKSKGLYKLVKNGDLPGVKYLLKESGINFKLNSVQVLMLSCIYNQLEIVKYLVGECGINVSIKNNFSMVYAKENGHLEVVKYLQSRRLNTKDYK